MLWYLLSLYYNLYNIQDYLKHLEVTSEDYDDTAAALAIVTEAAEHANETIKQMEKFQVKYYLVLVV